MLVGINIEVNTIMEIGEHCCFHSCGQLGKSIFIMWYNASDLYVSTILWSRFLLSLVCFDFPLPPPY